MFRKFAAKVSAATGSSASFFVAILIVAVWAISGPFFNFSDTWQLFINTGTTIATFLMVFLIQNTQNRDGRAMQLKLDELIRATKARDAFVDLESLTDEELDQLNKEFQMIHERQENSAVMVKLHQSIEKEHSRRKGKINDFLHKKI